VVLSDLPNSGHWLCRSDVVPCFQVRRAEELQDFNQIRSRRSYGEVSTHAKALKLKPNCRGDRIPAGDRLPPGYCDGSDRRGGAARKGFVVELDDPRHPRPLSFSRSRGTSQLHRRSTVSYLVNNSLTILSAAADRSFARFNLLTSCLRRHSTRNCQLSSLATI
jgi:hypothetical protein